MEMLRKNNTDVNGVSWSEEVRREIWEKGRIFPEYDPTIWRGDKCGRIMKFTDHGNRNSAFGWEIDHINPVSNGGDDRRENLQPLHWENNVKKGEAIDWDCKPL